MTDAQFPRFPMLGERCESIAYWGRTWIGAASLAFFMQITGAASAQSAVVYNVYELAQLRADGASARVDFQATVSYTDELWQTLFVFSNETGFLLTADWNKRDFPDFRVGEQIRVVGQLLQHGAIEIETLTSLGSHQPITPIKVPLNDSLVLYQTKAVELLLEIDSMLLGANHTAFAARFGNQPVKVRILGSPVSGLVDVSVDDWVGKSARIRGTLGTCPHQAALEPADMLFVSSMSDVTNSSPSSARTSVPGDTARAQPITTMRPATVRQSGNAHWRGKLVRLSGIVTFVEANKQFCLATIGGAIAVESSMTSSLPPGTLVEVDGIVRYEKANPIVVAKVVRIKPGRQAIPAQTVTAADVIEQVMDAEYVSTTGKLEGVQIHDGNCELILSDGPIRYRFDSPCNGEHLASLSLKPGDRVTCVGAVHLRPSANKDTMFDIVATTDAELTVANRKLSPTIAAFGLTALGFACLLGFAARQRLKDKLSLEPQHAEEPPTISGQMRYALEALADGILIVDDQDRIVDCNSSFQNQFGIRPVALSSASVVYDQIAACCTHGELFLESAERYRVVPEEATFELRLQKPYPASIAAHTAPIFDDATDVIGRVWTFQDLTDQLDLDEKSKQTEKMEAVGQLAGGIAHDFNNLLAGISANLSLAKQKADLPLRDSLSILDAADTATERASELVRHLLAFSGKSSLNCVSSDLNDIVGEVEQLVRPMFNSSVELRLDLEKNLPPCMVDGTYITQALLNICLNARDAMPSTGGRVVVSTNVVQLPGREHPCVAISVEDNGRGMSREVREKVFEPFFTTKDVKHGTGLGLSTSYGIVQQHHGWIDCESDEDSGSRFHVYLPVQQTDKTETPTRRPPQESTATGTESPPLVLFADDDALVRSAVTSLLRSNGFEVAEVVNGLELIEQLENGLMPDVLLMDLNMPVLDGVAAFPRIRALLPTMPVVLCSGYLSDLDQFATAAGGHPDAVLTKPFSTEKLLQVIGDAALAATDD